MDRCRESGFRVTRWVILLAAALSVCGCGGEDSTGSDTPTADRFSVIVTEAGDREIDAIKAVRAVTGLGLRDAKALVDHVPSVVGDSLSAAEAQRLAETLRRAGMTVEIRPQ